MPMNRMETGETEAGELRGTQYRWGCKYVTLRGITEWVLQKDSEAETKAMGGNRQESSRMETRKAANLVNEEWQIR